MSTGGNNNDTPRIEHDERRQSVRIAGALDLRHFAQAKAVLAGISKNNATIDLSGISRLDTAGALLLRQVLSDEGSAAHGKLVHIRPEHQALLDMTNEMEMQTPASPRKAPAFTEAIKRLGKAAIELWNAVVEFVTFTGHACAALAAIIAHPSRLRFNSIVHQMRAIGIEALPIIGLIAFMISIVLAYQGQVQLKPLGAEQYTVNLIAISVLREMGVLLTAIMIAGRSGSAFTAEIGTMKVREEVDALRVIGFDIFELLVMPRLIALLIALPLLTFFADIAGLVGGELMSLSLLDISSLQYWEQVRSAATGEDFFVGMIKAPVFAFIIALVGCMHGLKVSGSSESVGEETTASVVKSIFLVLVLDGLFSIYFQKVGI